MVGVITAPFLPMVGVITAPFLNEFGRAPAKKPGRAIRYNLFVPPLATQKGFSLQSLTRIVVHWEIMLH
jgi:hypothetical protein